MSLAAAAGVASSLIVFIGAVYAVVRGIVKQADAVDRATVAIGDLKDSIDRIIRTQNGHEKRLAVLEDRTGGRR